MKLELWTSDKLRIDHQSVKAFMQQMINRLEQGQARYGKPRIENGYLTRLGLELKAYRRTGNQEHLINIANYCWLERGWPEHKKAHLDVGVGSVTRGRGKGKDEE